MAHRQAWVSFYDTSSIVCIDRLVLRRLAATGKKNHGASLSKNVYEK